jgi:hypothetical protein
MIVIKTTHDELTDESIEVVRKKITNKLESIKSLNKLDNSKLQFYNGALNLKCCDNTSMPNVDILKH